MITQASFALGANGFGAFVAGPFAVGTRILGWRLIYSTAPVAASVRMGSFSNALINPSSATFLAAGNFSSNNNLTLGNAVVGDVFLPSVFDITLSGSKYFGIGLTTGAGGSFGGSALVELQAAAFPAIGGSNIPTGKVPVSNVPTSAGVGPLPHSPGFYGWKPGPG